MTEASASSSLDDRIAARYSVDRAKKLKAEAEEARTVRRGPDSNKFQQDRADLLALLWVAAYEKVMDQLPASTSRLLVEGAMGQAYRASQQLLAPAGAERKVA